MGKRLTAMLTVALAVTALAGCAPQQTSTIERTPPTHRESTVTPTPEPEPAVATPTPTPAPTATLSDGERHWLEVQVGAGTEVEQTYADMICPMHLAGREYYADLIGRQGDLTTAQVMAWFAEWCGD